MRYTRAAMILCPLCEHAQPEAGECEVCGKRLAPVPGAGEQAGRLDGLEPTGHAPATAPREPRLDGLEATAHAAAGPVAAAPLEVERTCAEPLDVDAPAVDGLERTAAALPEDRTPLPAFVSCRYCRTPALPGERICGRCGMRLLVAAGGAGEPATAGRPCGCGARVRGAACPSCGARAAP